MRKGPKINFDPGGWGELGKRKGKGEKFRKKKVGQIGKKTRSKNVFPTGP